MQLFTPAMRDNPYPFYAWLRAEQPVYFDAEHGFWLISRYADVAAALHDPRLLSSRDDALATLKEVGDEDLNVVYAAVADMTLFCDPPKHTRLRGLMQKAFAPKSLTMMHRQIKLLIDELLDPIVPIGQLDLINDFAIPLPMFVISHMLGVRREDRNLFQQWTQDFNTFTGKVNTNAEENDRTVRSMQAMFAYFRQRIGELRTRPEPCLLSELVAVEQQGDRLSEPELLANCVLLLSAGFETTAYFIGNAMLALLQHPTQMRQLRQQPDLMVSAIEELLRFDSSVQFTGRMAAKDIEWQGHPIKEGQFVMLLMGSANRDEARFEHPDQLDLARQDNKHLSFGYGPHFCLGAPLARLEAQVALPELLRRLANPSIATDKLNWRDNFSVRGLTTLPLKFSARHL